MARRPYFGPPRCIGSGVPGDWFEFGHYILPGTENLIRASYLRKSGLAQMRSRCRLCDSVRRYWKRDKDATAKAAQAHRRHADRMVAKGQAPDRATAIAMMNGGGVTIAWLAQQFLDAIGKPCPGLCFNPEVVDGSPVAHPHIITRSADLQLDWRDPQYPICIENAGVLEGTCNQQKAGRPWADFMNTQRAIRRNFLEAPRFGPPPVQDSLF
jgi:hypothetical protein